jgi:hypothetical protein
LARTLHRHILAKLGDGILAQLLAEKGIRANTVAPGFGPRLFPRPWSEACREILYGSFGGCRPESGDPGEFAEIENMHMTADELRALITDGLEAGGISAEVSVSSARARTPRGQLN